MRPEIVIIGAGPAGMAATLQLMRYGIHPLVIEQTEPGGLLENAGRIENYPGFPLGIAGPELKKLFQRQFYFYQPRLVQSQVQKLDYSPEQDLFLIETDKANYQTRLAVVASGSSAKKPRELEEVPDDLQSHIFYEIKELLQKRNKTIAVLGGGDIALDYALNLSQYHQVVLLCRSPDLKGLPLLRERTAARPAIRLLTGAVLAQVERGSACALAIRVEKNGRPGRIEADCLVCAVGREANKFFYTPRFRGLENALMQQGRLFLVGDVARGPYRQIAIAVGDGLFCAMRIAEILKEKSHESNR